MAIPRGSERAKLPIGNKGTIPRHRPPRPTRPVALVRLTGRRQVGPVGVSTSSMPSAASSSRMRSEVAKSLAARAASRSATSASMRGSEPLSSASGASAVGEAEARGRGRRRRGTPTRSAGDELRVAHRVPHRGQRLGRVEVVGQRRPEPARGAASTAAGSGSPPASRAVDGVADQAAVRGGGRLDRLPGERLLLAVVGLEEEVAEGQRVEAALDERVDHEHVALRLRDLLAAEVEELVVHPDPHPRVHVEHALALGHLVGVVHPDVVDAAGVDVEAGRRGTWWPWPSTRCASRGSRGPTASPTPAGARTPGGVSFHSAKSAGWRLASTCSTRPLVASSSRSRPANSA